MADVLYSYWRSSAAYRVRIALNLKGLAPEMVFIHLRHGDQRSADHLSRNPAGLVPVWQESDGFTLSQSLAIIEYLDEIHPDPALLPGDARQRAVIRQIALDFVADVHPVGNLRVMDKLTSDFGADTPTRADWYRHWTRLGFDAVEARLAATAGDFCVGDQVTLADICLIPQVYNARRFEMDLTPWPLISGIDARCSDLPAFAAAAPKAQPDAE